MAKHTLLTQFGLLAATAIGTTAAAFISRLRRSLPCVHGTLSLPMLHHTVTVQRDTWGIPHIYAQCNEDLFAALGFVHAQDRLWHMEMNRRVASGQLAELLGKKALSTDRFVRVLGFRRIAEREVALLDDNTRTIVNSYVQGINTFLRTHANRLPIEYLLLYHTPRLWDAADVLVWSKVIALSLSGNWTTELLNWHIAAIIGQQHPNDAIPSNDDIATQYITVPHHHDTSPTSDQVGSNAWVVHGARSANGAPLLASDPHLAMMLPPIWYQAHLCGGDYHVSGVTFPGMPGVVIGHNEAIAWGITNAMIDVQDLYRERFNRTNPHRYLWQSTWHDAEIITEEIAVRGRRTPHRETVRITRHGPVITPVATSHGSSPLAFTPTTSEYEEVLALRWHALEPGNVVRAALAINRAQQWHEFRAALALWDTPVQNMLYADTHGHIGFAVAGKVPLRQPHDIVQTSTLPIPMPGWDGEHEWMGTIPPAELPAAYDPPEGIIVNANNRIVDDSYPYPLPGNWFHGYRAQRIATLLQNTTHHTIASFGAIQNDIVSVPGLHIARIMAHIPLTTPLAQYARNMLVAWDGVLSANTTGGTVYVVLRSHIERLAFTTTDALYDGVVGSGIFRVVPYNSILERRALAVLLERIDASALGADPQLHGYDTWAALLHDAMERTATDLRQRLGSNPYRWHYGRIHRMLFRHPLGAVRGLSLLFNRKPVPIGGDIDTINVAYIPRTIAVAPSYRMICDTADWDESRCIMPAGQSGNPISSYYYAIDDWQNGAYHPMAWSRAEVHRHTVATLVLKPA